MPREKTEYYRYRKIFSSAEVNHPDFNEIKRLAERNIKRLLPEDANEFWSWSEYEHPHEIIEGAIIIDYFESEDEKVRYESVCENDPQIYKDYLKRKEEQEVLRKFRRNQ